MPEGREPLAAFRELLLEVKAAQPDLVLFVGDYIAEPDGEQLSVHRENIIEAMKLVDPVPRAVVLGNYETWSNADDWLSEFARLGVKAMENEVTIAQTVEGPVCVRGLGDKLHRYRYVDYPPSVRGSQDNNYPRPRRGFCSSRGLVIAGHTHCGQVSTFFGPLWVPSCPIIAHCGRTNVPVDFRY